MKHSDLAVESARIAEGIPGTRCISRTIGGVKITDIRLSGSAARDLSRRPGRYITLEGDPAGNALPALLKRALEQLLPPAGTLLAAGLGNPDITRDRLGALTVRRLPPRQGRRFSLAAIETDVALRTGIETAALVRSTAREIGAAAIIAVDSLCCDVPNRLYQTVQLTDAGITPGSGAAVPRKELSERTAGVPVIAVGVPSAALLSSITGDPGHQRFLAAPSDEDVQSLLWADSIAAAINAVIR